MNISLSRTVESTARVCVESKMPRRIASSFYVTVSIFLDVWLTNYIPLSQRVMFKRIMSNRSLARFTRKLTAIGNKMIGYFSRDKGHVLLTFPSLTYTRVYLKNVPRSFSLSFVLLDIPVFYPAWNYETLNYYVVAIFVRRYSGMENTEILSPLGRNSSTLRRVVRDRNNTNENQASICRSKKRHSIYFFQIIFVTFGDKSLQLMRTPENGCFSDERNVRYPNWTIDRSVGRVAWRSPIRRVSY